MTARPIRYQRQVSDRNGKIFYTSITSLSHINKWEGLLTLLAGVVSPILGTEVITELSAVGGVVFLGMGINMTGITDRKINISNLIPALIIPIIYMPFSAWIGGLF